MADNDDIPFNRDFPLKPGVVDEVRPGVRRVLCDNPSPFTFTGTVSYIVGQGKVAIIDPGPDNEAHAAALLDAVRGETVTHILVTHTHRDHSPNTARIKAATGATVYAEGPHRASRPRYESEKTILGIRRRPRLQARHRGARRRDHRGRRLGAAGGGDAGPYRQSSGVRLARAKDAFRRRSRDGLVDLDRGAAGRIDDRLHGLAGTAGAARRGFVFLRPRPGNPGRTALCAFPDPAPPGARSLDPASPRQRRSRHSHHGARDLYRHRSAADGRGRLFRAGASGGSGRARDRGDRRRSGDRRDVSVGE